MAQSQFLNARSTRRLREFATPAYLRARRDEIRAEIRKRNLLILSLVLVLVSALSLALVRSNEAKKSAAQFSARVPQSALGGCTEERYDPSSGQMMTVDVRCAAADFDSEGRPIYRGTIKRLDQIGKSFRDR